jgi:hypothetical protein
MGPTAYLDAVEKKKFTGSARNHHAVKIYELGGHYPSAYFLF